MMPQGKGQDGHRPSIPVSEEEDDPVYKEWTGDEEAGRGKGSSSSSSCCCSCKATSKDCCLMFSVVMNFFLTCIIAGIAIFFLLASLNLEGLSLGVRLCRDDENNSSS